MTVRSLTIAFARPADLVGLTLRPDMAAQFQTHGVVVPAGPAFTLRKDGAVLGMGGFERRPGMSGTALGWLLVGELTPREWAAGRRAMRWGLDWAARRGITRIYALATAAVPGAERLLAGLGFRPDGHEGDDVRMVLDIEGRR